MLLLGPTATGNPLALLLVAVGPVLVLARLVAVARVTADAPMSGEVAADRARIGAEATRGPTPWHHRGGPTAPRDGPGTHAATAARKAENGFLALSHGHRDAPRRVVGERLPQSAHLHTQPPQHAIDFEQRCPRAEDSLESTGPREESARVRHRRRRLAAPLHPLPCLCWLITSLDHKSSLVAAPPRLRSRATREPARLERTARAAAPSRPASTAGAVRG